MRIVFVSRFPQNIDHPHGGVETATVGLLRALQSNGLDDLHVVTLEKGLATERQEEEQAGIRIHRLLRSSWPMMIDTFIGSSAKRLGRLLDSLRPDIVHFQETWGLGGHGYEYPSVFTVHGFDSLNLTKDRPHGWRLRSRLWQIAEANGLKNQQFVISIAPYVTRMISPLTTASITEIWNTLDRRYFAVEKKEDANKILFLGWITPRKNPHVLVEAADRLREEFPSICFDLYGAVSNRQYASELERKIRQRGVDNHIKIHGCLSQTGVIEQISSASLLILPSLQENAPMVIAEAMAAGVPVIASRRCGIPDMIIDGETGFLIDPNDVGMITDRIAQLLNDDDLRTRMGERARELAIERFHPDSVARSTLDVYKRVIADFRGARRPVQADH